MARPLRHQGLGGILKSEFMLKPKWLGLDGDTRTYEIFKITRYWN